MANSCSTDHHCKLNNNIVLMFQNVNATNSALFALLSKISKVRISPQSFKNGPPFRQITQNSPTIFRFEQREMEPSKFTVNYAKIAQFATPSHESCEFRAILVKFYKSLLPNCTPTFYSKFREIRSLRKDSERLTRN